MMSSTAIVVAVVLIVGFCWMAAAGDAQSVESSTKADTMNACFRRLGDMCDSNSFHRELQQQLNGGRPLSFRNICNRKLEEMACENRVLEEQCTPQAKSKVRQRISFGRDLETVTQFVCVQHVDEMEPIMLCVLRKFKEIGLGGLANSELSQKYRNCDESTRMPYHCSRRRALLNCYADVTMETCGGEYDVTTLRSMFTDTVDEALNCNDTIDSDEVAKYRAARLCEAKIYDTCEPKKWLGLDEYRQQVYGDKSFNFRQLCDRALEVKSCQDTVMDEQCTADAKQRAMREFFIASIDYAVQYICIDHINEIEPVADCAVAEYKAAPTKVIRIFQLCSNATLGTDKPDCLAQRDTYYCWADTMSLECGQALSTTGRRLADIQYDWIGCQQEENAVKMLKRHLKTLD